MNYFDLFGLPVAFKADSGQLRSAFMKIQMASHPDKFAQSSAEEQEVALEQSAMANKGFTLLNNTEQLLPYVLEITGNLSAEEKYSLSPDFLMEMMELNESWMEADSQSEKEAILSEINTLKNDLFNPIKTYLEADSVLDIPGEAMLQIKDYYFKKKYLDRILEDFHH
jgi:molecular chaperone HscB